MAHVLTRDRLQRFFNAINISLFPSPIRRCHLRIASVPATNAKSFRFDINFQIKKMKSASNLFRELNKHLFFTWSPRIRIWVIGLKIKLFDAMTNIWRLAANIFKPSFCVDCQFSSIVIAFVCLHTLFRLQIENWRTFLFRRLLFHFESKVSNYWTSNPKWHGTRSILMRFWMCRMLPTWLFDAITLLMSYVTWNIMLSSWNDIFFYLRFIFFSAFTTDEQFALVDQSTKINC